MGRPRPPYCATEEHQPQLSVISASGIQQPQVVDPGKVMKEGRI